MTVRDTGHRLSTVSKPQQFTEDEMRAELESIRNAASAVVQMCDRALRGLEAVESNRPSRRAPHFDTELHAAVMGVVRSIWPHGKPANLRKFQWWNEIANECADAGIIVSERTIRRALGGR